MLQYNLFLYFLDVYLNLVTYQTLVDSRIAAAASGWRALLLWYTNRAEIRQQKFWIHYSASMTEPTPESLGEFFLFPILPVELRIKIWSYASRVPRLLELQYCIVDREFFSFQPPPSVLHTSQESRTVALSYFHLSFGTDKQAPSTYFNPVDDIVYFGSEQYGDEIEFMIKHFEKHSPSLGPRDQIQNLAMAEYLWRRASDCYSPFAMSNGNLEWSIRSFSRTFPHLRHLIFVKGRMMPYNAEGLIEWPLVPEGQSGRKSLVRSEPHPHLIKNVCFAYGAVKSWLDARKQRHPKRILPDVVVMALEYL